MCSSTRCSGTWRDRVPGSPGTWCATTSPAWRCRASRSRSASSPTHSRGCGTPRWTHPPCAGDASFNGSPRAQGKPADTAAPALWGTLVPLVPRSQEKPMQADVFRAWIEASARVIEEQRDHLTQLDAAIGDADHGINLARGFTAVLGALETAAPATPGAVLTLTGSTLISKVGGASGPLYGVAFRRAGKALGAAATVDLAALEQALEAALAGVHQLGAAREGDKTMVDALAPATRAFGKAIAEGASAA